MKKSMKMFFLIVLAVLMVILPACNAPVQEEEYDMFPEQEQNVDFKMTKFVLTPDREVGEEELESMSKTMIKRLNDIYQYRNNFKVYDGKIYVLIEDIPNAEEVLREVSASDKMTMLNADGEIIFDASGISSANNKYGILTKGGERQHFVELIFTAKGKEDFRKATKAVAERTDGNHNIYIAIDGKPITALTANSEINSNVCRITGDFTAESAKKLAVTISSGAISVGFNVEPYVETANGEQ